MLSEMKKLFVAICIVACIASTNANGTTYNVGIGIADTTGPAAEIGMMGYAKAGQNTHGIHLRLFSRAFIFQDGANGAGKRSVFVSVDAGMMGALIKLEVVKKLQEMYGPELYTHANVVLSGTHTHSGPAGFLQYVLFDVTSMGFVDDTFQAMVQGITLSIQRAHENMALSTLYWAEGEIPNANINRSPTSYLANPQAERAQYNGKDTDHTMVQLNIFAADSGKPRGVINWFAVHPTSMNNTNKLISGDNKGKASQLLEKEINGKDTITGKGKFVAAFASTNLGDVSPNLKGPHCIDTGLPCDLVHSTCNGRTEKCMAAGPGKDMFESTKIIAERQYKMARSLLFAKEDEQTAVEGSVDFVHQWIDMSNQEVRLDDGSVVKTCKPALGYSFAAGTTDGPGAFDFTQGTNTSNPFWNFVIGIIKDPSPEQDACHAPKPILLDTGEITWPYDWHPRIIDTQILKVGQFVMAAVPGEFTTMSGRRMRKTVKAALTSAAAASTSSDDGSTGSADYKVVVAGLSNVYTHYITTFEEYQRQRYEAASTIFGPHSLQAYQQQYARLADAMIKGENVDEGQPPINMYHQQISFVPGVLYDNPPLGGHFGNCLQQPPSQVRPGDVVTVKFVAGHLRNNPMLESSFLYVHRKQEEGGWKVVATDADWETKLHWKRTHLILGESEVTIEWAVPEDTPTGTYRITHQGYSKNMIKKTFYSGQCNEFAVVNGTVNRRADQTNAGQTPHGGVTGIVSSIKDRVTKYVSSHLEQFYYGLFPGK